MQVTVTDLAQAAGVARGTIYNNLGDLTGLFDLVAAQLAAEMNERVAQAVAGFEDPALRLASGIRLCLRRAHEEPEWGRFVSRFGYGVVALREIWAGQPLADLRAGLERGRYAFQASQLDSVIGFISGATLAAIFAVLEGARTWREAGSDVAELTLIARGLPRDEARAIASAPLPL